MNPDAVEALDAQVAGGTVDPRAAVRLRRAASGELVSVDVVLRLLLWAGVALTTTGVGLLVKQNLERLGPVTIAVFLGAASAGCLAWSWRRAPRYARGETPSPGIVFDAILLLGALLAAADLAYVEVKLTPLGANWPWHLLILSIAYAALAARFDARALFSLALTSFAAWRGVSIAVLGNRLFEPIDDRLFLEGLLCGAAFLALGRLLERLRFKAHFEPVAATLGWGLVFASLGSRLFSDAADWPVCAAATIACGVVIAWFAWHERSLPRYALGLGAVAFGLIGPVLRWGWDEGLDSPVRWAIVLILAGVAVAVLLREHAAWQKRA